MPSPELDDDGIRQAQHAERVEQAEQACEERYQQGDLQGERSGVGVDPDDLGLHVRGLAGELFVQGGVGHHLRIVLERRRYLLLLGGVEHGAVLCHVA